jgi:hypothetical protein
MKSENPLILYVKACFTDDMEHTSVCFEMDGG